MARPKNERAMSVAELRQIIATIGGQRAASRRLDCAPATLFRYLRGTGIPSVMATKLRLAAFDVELAIGVFGSA